MDDGPLIFDRALVRRRLARAAPGAAAHDFLYRWAAERLIDRLADVKRPFRQTLLLGSRSAGLAALFRAQAAVGELVQTSLVAAALDRGAGPALVMDEEWLPFAPASFDLVVSPLGLHWVNDLPGTLIQIARVLRPDGLLLAALPGGRTLAELRRALLAAEAEMEGGASPRVAPFLDVREGAGLLQRAGFALPVADAETVTVTYADPLALMRELRGAGETNALRTRRGFLARPTLARALAIYAEQHAGADGRVPASFELVTLTGWAPHESQPKPLRPGSARHKLADALGTEEKSAGAPAGPQR